MSKNLPLMIRTRLKNPDLLDLHLSIAVEKIYPFSRTFLLFNSNLKKPNKDECVRSCFFSLPDHPSLIPYLAILTTMGSCQSVQIIFQIIEAHFDERRQWHAHHLGHSRYNEESSSNQSPSETRRLEDRERRAYEDQIQTVIQRSLSDQSRDAQNPPREDSLILSAKELRFLRVYEFKIPPPVEVPEPSVLISLDNPGDGSRVSTSYCPKSLFGLLKLRENDPTSKIDQKKARSGNEDTVCLDTDNIDNDTSVILEKEEKEYDTASEDGNLEGEREVEVGRRKGGGGR